MLAFQCCCGTTFSFFFFFFFFSSSSFSFLFFFVLLFPGLPLKKERSHESFYGTGKSIRLNKLACLDVTIGNTKALPLLQEGGGGLQNCNSYWQTGNVKSKLHIPRAHLERTSHGVSTLRCLFRAVLKEAPAPTVCAPTLCTRTHSHKILLTFMSPNRLWGF